jgi:soluble lytic murein transglycosylase-like protein
LIKAIIANESGFNANATSGAGAQGLMQLMPGTAAGLGVTDAYDPAQNVAGGTKYIKGLLQRFNGDVRLAVAAYNAGPGAVEKYGGVPPYAETQNYVQNVLSSYAKYRGSSPQ